jgi:alginate O-acetyltransferase complex protein AlgI
MLAASYIFYALTSAPYLPLLVFVGALAQQTGAYALRAVDAKTRALRAYAAVSVLVILLIVVRTPTAAELLARSFLALSDGPLARFVAGAAPLGFSFYVFEAIGYLVEVAKGREKPYAFWDFQLFVAFFPHLLSGPIMRAKDLIGQLHAPDGLRPREIQKALALVLWGLFLKLALSDQLAPRLDPYFNGPGPATLAATDALVVSLGYGLQMYLDFLGYSLIAIGAGLLCGARLVANFNHPFSAESPADFWNRWHISLSRWIRDYVFLAAVGRSRSLARLCFAALLAFALCGLWHQWSIKFLVWGLFHGAVLALYHVYRSLIGAKAVRALADGPAALRAAYDVASIAATTVILLPGWVLFRAPSFQRAADLLASLVAFARPRTVPTALILHVAALYALALSAPAAGRVLDRILAWEETAGGHARLTLGVARGLALGVVATSILVFWGGHSAFIYLQF